MQNQLTNSEPYVLYNGFELGSFPNNEALKELNQALKSHFNIIILIDDTKFSKKLLSFVQNGEVVENEDARLYQKAILLIDSKVNLVSSLPKDATHPALLFIKNSFESDINQRVAPELVNSQIENWGLNHPRIKAFSKTMLEQKVA